MVFQDNTVISGYCIINNKKVKVKDTVYNLCQDSLCGEYPEQIFMDNGQQFLVSDFGMFTIIN